MINADLDYRTDLDLGCTQRGIMAGALPDFPRNSPSVYFKKRWPTTRRLMIATS
jgi:hypothetical protein